MTRQLPSLPSSPELERAAERRGVGDAEQSHDKHAASPGPAQPRARPVGHSRTSDTGVVRLRDGPVGHTTALVSGESPLATGRAPTAGRHFGSPIPAIPIWPDAATTW